VDIICAHLTRLPRSVVASIVHTWEVIGEAKDHADDEDHYDDPGPEQRYFLASARSSLAKDAVGDVAHVSCFL